MEKAVKPTQCIKAVRLAFGFASFMLLPALAAEGLYQSTCSDDQKILLEQKIDLGNKMISENSQKYLTNQEALMRARQETNIFNNPFRYLQLQTQGPSIEKQLSDLAMQIEYTKSIVSNLQAQLANCK